VCFTITFHAFFLQFAAVCIASLKEVPTISSSLMTLEARLDRLCREYKVPPPPPPGSAPDSNISNNGSGVDLKVVSHSVEKNCGVLIHTSHQAKELVITMENALKRARTAFVW
jgi:hypothetical protein